MSKPVKHYDKWRIRWVDETGKRQSAVFDTYRDAAAELHRQQVAVEEARRTGNPSRAQNRTFAELADYWEKHRIPASRSPKDQRSILRKHLRPSLDAVALVDLTMKRIEEFAGSVEVGSPKTLHNILAVLKAMLHVAVELDWATRVPVIHMPAVGLFSKGYRYLKNTEEVRRVLAAARDHGKHVFALYVTAVHTGLREGELACLDWSDVDFERRLITVQRSYNGLVKDSEVRYVPILDALLPALKAWRLQCPGVLVFPNETGRRHGPSAAIFQETLHSVLKAAGFPHQRKRGEIKPYVTFHDLRHTFASHWVLNGGDIFRLQKILGHSDIKLTQRYAHLHPAAYVDDYGRLGAAQDFSDAQVVEIRKRA